MQARSLLTPPVLALISLLILFAAPAALAGLKRIEPGDSVSLDADQGLIVVAVDTEDALHSVRLVKDGKLLGSGVLRELPKGRSYALYRAEAGLYQWKEIQRIAYWRFKLDEDPELKFEVKAGQLNYPGDLLFDGHGLFHADWLVSNRSLRALDWLQRDFPELLARYEFAYTGHYPDPFPAYYKAYAAARKGVAVGDDRLTPAEATELPLKPELLWQRAQTLSADISPDGRFVAVQLRPEEERWQIDLIDLKQSTRRVIAASDKPYASVEWSGKNRLIMEVGDYGRRIIEMLRIAPVDQGDHGYAAVRLRKEGLLVDTLPHEPDHILFGSYSLRGDLMVHRVDMSSQRTVNEFKAGLLARINHGVKNDLVWFTDGRGRLRLALAQGDDGPVLMYGIDEEYTALAALEDLPGFRPLTLSFEGDQIYGLTDDQRGQRDLVVYDIASRQFTQTLFSREGVDVNSVILDPQRVPIGISYYNQGQLLTEYFAASDQKAQRLFQRAFAGKSTRLISRSADGKQQLHVVDGGDQPGQLFHFDAPARNAALLFDLYPELAELPFVATTPLRVERSESMAIDAFLTLPESDGKRPLVIYPHGGPIGVADTLHFNRDVQFLASLGYAVLQINFRGSDGYGRAFREAGHRNYGTLIEDDIDATIKQVLADYPIDAERMCMLGSSYGGYSALIASVRWPERFRCAVSMSGVSDRLLHFTATDSAQTPELREMLEKVIGNPRTDFEAMRAASPIYQIDDLTTPLLLIHGLKDQRVDPEHSYRLARLLKLDGRPASGLLFPDEGHGIADPATQHKMWRVIAAFLQQHLNSAVSKDVAAAES